MARIKVTIPYDIAARALSKNVTLKRSDTGMYKPREGKKSQSDLWFLMRAVINRPNMRSVTRFVESKVWVKIMVYRKKDPNGEGPADIDPINFLTAIADAAKLAIHVDDDWFSAVVDWEVDAENPRIEVVIEQEVK